MDCEQRDRVTQERSQTRGACPGAFTPMLSGDGWLVRIRSGARALSSRELRELARLAHAYGNGTIELTRRANLQLRGLRLERISELQAELVALGLVDASPVREGRPGLLVDPVAAIEDVALSELALGLDEALAASVPVGKLSAKLGVVIDAGSGSVSAVDADIRVVASGDPEHMQIYVGTYSGDQLLGACERAEAPAVVLALLSALAGDAGPRMRDLVAARGIAAVRAEVTRSLVHAARVACVLQPEAASTLHGNNDSGPALGSPSGAASHIETPHADGKSYSTTQPSSIARAAQLRAAPLLRSPSYPLPLTRGAQLGAALGFHAAAGGGWFGIGLPFGSALHAEWVAIAELAERFGAAAVRLTPGREVLIGGVRRELGVRLAEVASRLGFITALGDPRMQVVACSGAPACSSAYGETRSLAGALGVELQPLLAAGATLHVSGCEKGCASRAVAHFSIVLAQGGARLAFDADVAAASGAPIEALATISAKLRACEERRIAMVASDKSGSVRFGDADGVLRITNEKSDVVSTPKSSRFQ
ncbi:MAG TPA: precorrin-3B synthase [Polyangiales bacterium]|nr:precorrin-3B synthase [Polyangiales bacterium]